MSSQYPKSKTNRKKKISNFQKGSALIITLLVVTVVSAMIFSAGTLALKELKMSRQLEESDQAYYAAEAGIELGLLMYRFNHDVETFTGATATDSEPIRVDLSSPSTPSTPSTPPTPSHFVFDLKIWHRNEPGEPEIVPSTTDEGGTIIPALEQDGVKEYDLSAVENKITMNWEYENKYPTLDEQDKMRLEYVAYDGNGEIVGKKLYFYNDRNRDLTLKTLDEITPLPLNNSNTKTLRLKSWGADIKDYTIKVEEGSADKMDSQLTFIESTGYYAGAKRKLQIQIDRASGTMLGLYDFTLFGSSGITNP